MGATWKFRACGAIIATLACAGAAQAGITPIGQFQGQFQEGFEGRGFTWTSGNVPVFSGLAIAHERSQGSLLLTGSWYFEGGVTPKEGARFLGSTSSWVQYNFNVPLTSFGGFFTTNSPVANGRVDFFLDGNLLHTQPLTAPKGGVWAWNGWTLPTGFDAVRLTSNYSAGGFLMHDALQATTIPAPGAALAGGLVLLAGFRRVRRA